MDIKFQCKFETMKIKPKNFNRNNTTSNRKKRDIFSKQLRDSRIN
jgi:hypothetical protein